MTQKQFRKLRFIIIIALLAFIPFLLLNKGGCAFFKSHVHEYWLLTRLPLVLFPLIAYLGSKLNQSRSFFIALAYWVLYILLYSSYTRILDWLPLTGAISIASIALPTSIIFIFYIGEGKIVGPKGAQLAAASFLPTLVLFYMVYQHPTFTNTILFFHGPELERIWHIPIVVVPLFIWAVVGIVAEQDKSFFHFRFASLPSFLLSIITLHRMEQMIQKESDPLIYLTVNLTVISAMLLYALYQLYWERAYIDELTGIPNRRTLNERLKKIDGAYSLVMIDIDHFKKLNDTYGHTEGDNVLKYLAAHMGRVFGDIVFRYGGEEFCVILEGTPMHEAAELIDRFRSSVSSKNFILRRDEKIRQKSSKKNRGHEDDFPYIQVTFSAGLGCKDFPGEDARDIIDQADKALYKAKENGRNCVFYYGPSRRAV